MKYTYKYATLNPIQLINTEFKDAVKLQNIFLLETIKLAQKCQ